MAARSVSTSAWALARRQYWVISKDQLRDFGLTRAAIRHRVERGRLHRLWPNAYAVGRAEVSFEGICLAAVFTSGDEAVVSHLSAAALWRIVPSCGGVIQISVPSTRRARRRRGIRICRRRTPPDATTHMGIPLTTPAQTIIDVAARVSEAALERMINEADKLDLLYPAQLREIAEGRPGPGPKRVRELLDRQTFVLTQSELERLFVPLARRAGLPPPETQARVNGFKVDFYFSELDLVVETDGGRFHRTPAQQTRDRLRDQAHLAAGLKPLRFSHSQINFHPDHVVATLRAVAAQSP
jgi:very-short-patch-repair endonuclease